MGLLILGFWFGVEEEECDDGNGDEGYADQGTDAEFEDAHEYV